MLKFKARLFLVIFLFPLALLAQPCGGGCGTPGCPPCDPGAPVPIPGVFLIFLAGLVLGVLKLNKKKPQ